MALPKLRLSRLRDIGWALWDPIGLLGKDENWENTSFADEYDTYLIHAAGQLCRNISSIEVVEYLAQIEIEYMGMGRENTRQRAESVVESILTDDELWNTPVGE